MISDASIRQIELALWPQGDATPGSLWAVLDCARHRRIYRELQVSRLDHQCLYGGDVPPVLKSVAPHIVELSPRYGFTRTLLGQCWGQSWGVFVRLNDSTTLRHHLKKLLTVQTEDGRKLLFRFYDPRVLRPYLPTCTPRELEQVFGPVTTYFAEAADAGQHLLAFNLDGHRLVQRTVDIMATAAAVTRP